MAQEFLGFMFDPQLISELNAGIIRAVNQSYTTAPVRERTDVGDRERVRLCIVLIRVMRGDMKWSVQRIVDNLAAALTARVQGESWEPAKNTAWAGDNAKLIVDPVQLRHAMPD